MIKIFKKTKTFYIKSQSGFSMTSRLSQRSKSCPRAHRCSRLRFQNPNTLRQEWNPSLKTAKQQGSSWIIERHPQSYFCPEGGKIVAVPLKPARYCASLCEWRGTDVGVIHKVTWFALAALSMLTMIVGLLSSLDFALVSIPPLPCPQVIWVLSAKPSCQTCRPTL